VTTTYTAKVTREGRWWLVAVPDIDGLTQARRIGEAELMARELIAITLDVNIDDIEVAVVVESVDDIDVAGTLAEIKAHRAEASRLEQYASAAAANLAKALVARQIPLRDVGAILGVSHQRAHQLVSGGMNHDAPGRARRGLTAGGSPGPGGAAAAPDARR
jgi:hypothetical protein